MDKKATNAFSLCSRSDTAVRKPKEQQHVFGSNAQRLTPEEIARVANHDKPIQV
jgi:hypothetical protein